MSASVSVSIPTVVSFDAAGGGGKTQELVKFKWILAQFAWHFKPQGAKNADRLPKGSKAMLKKLLKRKAMGTVRMFYPRVSLEQFVKRIVNNKVSGFRSFEEAYRHWLKKRAEAVRFLSAYAAGKKYIPKTVVAKKKKTMSVVPKKKTKTSVTIVKKKTSVVPKKKTPKKKTPPMAPAAKIKHSPSEPLINIPDFSPVMENLFQLSKQRELNAIESNALLLGLIMSYYRIARTYHRLPARDKALGEATGIRLRQLMNRMFDDWEEKNHPTSPYASLFDLIKLNVNHDTHAEIIRTYLVQHAPSIKTAYRKFWELRNKQIEEYKEEVIFAPESSDVAQPLAAYAHVCDGEKVKTEEERDFWKWALLAQYLHLTLMIHQSKRRKSYGTADQYLAQIKELRDKYTILQARPTLKKLGLTNVDHTETSMSILRKYIGTHRARIQEIINALRKTE